MSYHGCGPFGTVSPPARALLESTGISVLHPAEHNGWRALARVEEEGVLTADARDALRASACSARLESLGDVRHLLITPDAWRADTARHIVLYVHGGAYTVSQPEALVPSLARLAALLQAPVFAMRYPLAWQKTMPFQRELVQEVYERLLLEYAPSGIAVVGDSAGGGLALLSLLRMRAHGLPSPASVGLLSPWADLSKTGHSFYIGADGLDPGVSYDDTLAASAKLFANGRDLQDPQVSPLYGDYAPDFPPTFISTGTRDVLLSVCARLQAKLIDSGVPAALHLYEGMPHGFEENLQLPESAVLWRDLSNFIKRHWAS